MKLICVSYMRYILSNKYSILERSVYNYSKLVCLWYYFEICDKICDKGVLIVIM